MTRPTRRIKLAALAIPLSLLVSFGCGDDSNVSGADPTEASSSSSSGTPTNTSTTGETPTTSDDSTTSTDSSSTSTGEPDGTSEGSGTGEEVETCPDKPVTCKTHPFVYFPDCDVNKDLTRGEVVFALAENGTMDESLFLCHDPDLMGPDFLDVEDEELRYYANYFRFSGYLPFDASLMASELNPDGKACDEWTNGLYTNLMQHQPEMHMPTTPPVSQEVNTDKVSHVFATYRVCTKKGGNGINELIASSLPLGGDPQPLEQCRVRFSPDGMNQIDSDFLFTEPGNMEFFGLPWVLPEFQVGTIQISCIPKPNAVLGTQFEVFLLHNAKSPTLLNLHEHAVHTIVAP